MALDPESQRLIDLMAAANRPAWNTLSPQAARDLYLSLRPGAQGPRPAEVTVVDRTIPGPAGNIPVRLYRPASVPADAALPALVYAHGGGWVFGNLDSHDVLCAQLAIEAGIVVFHIDYRLAPEARFPGAFDDVVAGLTAKRRDHREAAGVFLERGVVHPLPGGKPGGVARRLFTTSGVFTTGLRGHSYRPHDLAETGTTSALMSCGGVTGRRLCLWRCPRWIRTSGVR